MFLDTKFVWNTNNLLLYIPYIWILKRLNSLINIGKTVIGTSRDICPEYMSQTIFTPIPGNHELIVKLMLGDFVEL